MRTCEGNVKVVCVYLGEGVYGVWGDYVRGVMYELGVKVVVLCVRVCKGCCLCVCGVGVRVGCVGLCERGYA